MYDLIIIGGGPAGLTAAIYAIRKRLNCLLISPDLGGKALAHTQIAGADTYQVINGADLVRRFRHELEYLDFARVLEKAVRLEQVENHFAVTTSGGRRLEAWTVILATGADAVRLAVPGADRYFLNGVLYSTVSYAPLYIGKTVALVGAGNMALRGVGELAQIVKQLYWVAPTHGELDTPLGRRMQAAEHVTLLENWEPVAVDGDTAARQLVVKSPDGERAHARCGRHLRRAGPQAAFRAGAGLGRAGSRATRRGQQRGRDQRPRPFRRRRRDASPRRAGVDRDRRGRQGGAERVRVFVEVRGMLRLGTRN